VKCDERWPRVMIRTATFRGSSTPPISLTASRLDLVVELGLHVNCGSPDMIDQLGQRRPGANVTLRINPGFGHGHSQKTNTGGEQSKHGIWHEQVDECLLRADRHGVTVTGIHMHIGSGTDLEHLSQVCAAMERVVAQVGRTVTTISSGGGLPVPYRAEETFIDLDQYYQLWDASRNRISESLGHKVRLEIEPGDTWLPKPESWWRRSERSRRWAATVFSCSTPVLTTWRVRRCTARTIRSRCARTTDRLTSGPRSTRLSVVRCANRATFLPRPKAGLSAADDCRSPMWAIILVLGNAGAYGFAMSSNYNSKTRAAEVMIEGGQAKLIRSRETFDDLVRGEVIPD
jgi:diaminopimelate decarboxylase